MAMEIERKFLVCNDDWREQVLSETHLMQGYLASTAALTVRVRLDGGQGRLTIKGATRGISRSEYEYPIPAEDAQAMLNELAETAIIDKVRHRVRCGEHVWEVDWFAGDNAGLVLAEIELAAENESFERPAWLGAEVSDDPRYYNANLARHPFKDW
ncbi:CYTH domain-containing protein [Halochromatium roseum]|uniref:CYTH domain-containing protein n=1 Tax=Halochromatium roseum TaxID=391920 RepID=UPI00191170D5|nr:CYTH domain-containing protein [Halochromatium roseum]MBK5939173.1 adenylate cyclase [Halochromatium roseum]